MPSVHSDVVPRWQREIQWPGNLKQWWQQLTTFDKPRLSDAASRIEHANSWNDVDQEIDEYGN